MNGMLVLRIFWLGIILLAVPTVVGTLFSGLDKHTFNLPFWWVGGQMLLWAGMEVITVPFVLTKGRLTEVVWLFSGYTVLLLLVAALRLVIKRRKRQTVFHVVSEDSDIVKKEKKIFWIVFWMLLLLQLVLAVVMTYADGDDAFYVATASLAEESDLMYQKGAYNGGIEPLNARYGLAPFPMWIAYLARISGIRTVSVAHIFVPLALIPMTYAIFYLLGSRLFAQKRERIPLFLIATELLIIFGDHSFNTAENFMIARSRQGKAALGNIMIPMLIFLLFILLERLHENREVPCAFWGLLLCTLTATCLCSTLGTMLTCVLVGVTGLLAAFCYRRWKILFPMALCCTPCVVVALLYLMV